MVPRCDVAMTQQVSWPHRCNGAKTATHGGDVRQCNARASSSEISRR
ncbi:hypothetical protein BIFGAL_02910 [Bifidobacterium gallicum DSM 20093 = LMG 11596]|uniref:Uncharacterized protein n=1 Tax=Bifidobacterium gallicum DSM 20093 = LMG 11596 TaxID=561180 RepID=D1NSZ9_9BIFI|nr:hypothetical protein BIFGAL_02910 [Bifidobacterium gallicum DSM 20093 = LMG 11596]